VDRIGTFLANSVVLEDGRRDHLRDVGILVLLCGFDQCLNVSPVKEFPELGLEILRLARGHPESPVLVHDHSYRNDGQQGEASHHRASEYSDVP
jgi:hypothetical protein